MSTKETAVRAAAINLHDAILAARKAGLRVEWPATIEGLTSIAISDTRAAEDDPPVTDEGRAPVKK